MSRGLKWILCFHTLLHIVAHTLQTNTIIEERNNNIALIEYVVSGDDEGKTGR